MTHWISSRRWRRSRCSSPLDQPAAAISFTDYRLGIGYPAISRPVDSTQAVRDGPPYLPLSGDQLIAIWGKTGLPVLAIEGEFSKALYWAVGTPISGRTLAAGEREDRIPLRRGGCGRGLSHWQIGRSNSDRFRYQYLRSLTGQKS